MTRHPVIYRPVTYRAVMFALAALAFGTMPVLATAPETSLRPQVRPHAPPVVARALVSLPPLRPILRPVSAQQMQETGRSETLAYLGPDVSMRPFPRPDSIVQEALFGRRKKRKGSVCGNLEIQGKKIGRVPGRISECGVKDAVSVLSVSGVMLSRPATMDCDTARALNSWVESGVKPAFRRSGPVVELKVAGHYVCRTRNNQRGARVSEHGKGKAIDISAFKMSDGAVIAVASGWGQGAAGRSLREAWKAACGPFGTVLGPQADRFHRDHFHVDTASYRGGPYCK